jgi:glycosyltransferase involved in cell wall biosynthesis
MPTISILMPVFNCAKFLNSAIESVIAQTYSDWELIVVDDASTDDSFSIASSYSNSSKHIRVFRNNTNLGMLDNWNYGIGLCRGEFVAKLDADDMWAPTMLAKCLEVMQKYQDVGIVFSKYIEIDESSNELPHRLGPLPDFASNKPFSCVPIVRLGVNKMLQYPILRQGLGLIRRSVFDRLGLYRYLITKETSASTDTEFYFRVGCHYSIYCIDEFLYYYRIHATSISRRDIASGLQEKKMFEIKVCINDYYFREGKIEKEQWINNRNSALFSYRTFLLYMHRRNNEMWKFFKLFIQTFLKSPTEVGLFYLHRMLERSR